jgi:CRISPR/Cas system-associated protein Csx1
MIFLIEKKKVLFKSVSKKKKKYSFGKKIKSIFKGLKSLKIVKMHFWQKLKSKAFAKKFFFFFFYLKALFLKRNLK